MKKKFTMLIAALALLTMMFQPLRMLGQTRDSYSYTFTTKVFDANNQTQTLNEVDWTFAGTASSGEYYGFDTNKGQQFGSSSKPFSAFTLSTSGISGTITEIKVNTSGASNISGTLNVTVGGNAFGDEYTLTKDATEVTFSGSGTGAIAFNYAQTSSKAIYIKSISVTYSSGGGTVTTPSISANNVNIAYDATSGSIPYTISNPTPGTLLNATTTANWVSNISVNDSEVTFDATQNTASTARTATFTLTYTGATDKTVTVTQAAAPVVYTTIPALFEAATIAGNTATNVNVTFGNWVVSGISTNGKNVFVTDGTNGFVIFNNNGNLGFSVGDILSGTVACKVQLYNGFAEITQLTSSTDGISIASGGTVTAANIEMANLAGVNTGALVHYDNLTCSVNGNNYFLSDGTTTLQVYNSLYSNAYSTLEANKVYNISGVYQQYNATKEVLPRSAADIVEVVANPTLTVSPASLSGFTYTEGSGPSAAQSFTVAGSNLTENVSIAAPTNFVVCATESGTYTASLTFNPTSGTLATKRVYVKLAAGLGVNDYSGDLTATSGTATQTVALSGSVTAMPVVETPTFTPAEGTYTEAQNVTIACATAGATIYYTTDGSEPAMTAVGVSGTQYTRAITVSETTTLKAIAIKDGYANSEVASATYTIQAPAVTQTFNRVSNHNVEEGRTYLIVDVTSSRALTSANLAQSAPTAVEVTILNNDSIVTNEEALMWTFESTDGGYIIHPMTDDSKWLYTTNSNNGVRVGTNANKYWSLNITGPNSEYHGFKNDSLTRYLGVYNNQDWRTYTTIHNNIKNTQIELFVLGDAPQSDPQLTTSVSQLSGFSYTVNGGPSSAQSFILSGSDLTADVIVTAPDNFEVCATESGTYGSTLTIVPTRGSIAADTVYVRMAAGLSANSYSGTLTATCDDINVRVALSGSVTDMPIAATPTFSPAEGTFLTAQTVSISCTTENATIHYTTDGTNPTADSPVYTQPISIDATTTLKAAAIADGYAISEPAQATYTILEAMPIAEARALAANEMACVEGTVIFIDGRNVYVQDATAGIDLYLNNNSVPSDLAIGDLVRAYGKRAAYNGLVELSGINGNDANAFVVLSNGNELPLAVTTIAEIAADYSADNLMQSTRVKIENAIIGAINTGGNTALTQDGESINIYQIPEVEGLEEGDRVTLTAIVGCHNAPQLRVVSIDDIEFNHISKLIATPASLSGFTYAYEDGGPSELAQFALSGMNLEGTAYVLPSESFEVSTFGGDMFVPESPATVIAPSGSFNDLPIFVRMKAGLDGGTYNERLALATPGADTIYVNVSGTVTGGAPTPPTPPVGDGDYVRIADLSQLTDGSQVIIAARYNENANQYEAAANTLTSGKLSVTAFVSTTNADGAEILPAAIVDDESSYYWTVGVSGNHYTFTNAEGNTLSYNSGTNFNLNGENDDWTIEYQTSEENAMVPYYQGFVATNVSTTTRAMALQLHTNGDRIAPYAVSNMNSAEYNFFLDIFVKDGEGGDTPTNPVVATPTFTPEAGTYTEAQTVTIGCATEGATIHYTLDGTDPTVNSAVYGTPLTIDATTTVKAFAVKDGYDDSAIATAEYVIEETPPTPPTPAEGDYVRIADLSQLTDGSQVIIAARHDNVASSYYAMSNATSGKPTGVLFTSATSENGEILPASIVDEESSYYWSVGVTNNGITLTNANGEVMGWTSGTNFATGGDNTEWSVESGIAGESAMVPGYSGFTITNINSSSSSSIRGFALNNQHNYGTYAVSNNNNADYNFFLDLFVKGEGGEPVTPTVATPTFTPAAGTYYEPQEVTINCGTADATIYYSLESENGPWTEYEDAITVAESATLWAYATKEGYNDSPVTNATYDINGDLYVIFNQDWENDWHGWTQVSVEGETAEWTISQNSGNHYAYMNAYQQGANEDWLISPAFDLDSYTDVVLTFRTAKNYQGDDIVVYFSNDYDGQDPTTATWQPLDCALSTGSWNWVESGAISLDAFSGDNCYIAYKYTSTEDLAAGWEVDDILLVSGSAGIPVIIATPNALGDFEYQFGQGPSASRSYILTSANLVGEGHVDLAVSDDFEISLDNDAFGSSLMLEYANGAIINQPLTVYVRMSAGLEAGSYTGTISHTGGGAVATATLTGIVHGEGEPVMASKMPLYIQGNNGSNNNRVPVAVGVTLSNLAPNATYRYVNQFVDNNDGAETAGAGNVIYANANGFYRSTNPSLSTEGGYGEFTTDAEGKAYVWLVNEPTANARFTPGNHVYMRLRINDGNDGTSVAHIFTSGDYATVLNFGNDRDEYQGTAFFAKSDEAPMNFAMLYQDVNHMDRPVYSTSIEAVGVDYAGINQYADFYKDEVAGNNGWFGGILPNDNATGVNIIRINDMDGVLVNEYETTLGEWYPEAVTANPDGGLEEPIFIDLTYTGVDENLNADVKIWNTENEIVIENGGDDHYTMTVFSLLGQAMMQKQINAGSTVRISHDLAKGLYVINLQNNRNRVSAKVIVR